ncbi:MAG: AMP-binding protein [Pseudodonghicola sp.]
MTPIQTLSENGARHFGDRVALVFEGRSTSYRELDQAANRLARFILQSGVAQGERIAILSDNCDTYVTLYLAAAKAGAVAVPINMRLSDTEIVTVLQDCAPKLNSCGDGYHQKAATHALEVESILDVIDLADAGFADRMASYDSTAPPAEVGPDDLAVIMYTGGTTGRPKGVMLNHGNIMTAAISAALHTGMSRDDTTCFVLPIFHVAWWPLLAVLLVGGKAVIIRPPDIDGIMKLVEEHRCTHINMVPTVDSQGICPFGSRNALWAPLRPGSVCPPLEGKHLICTRHAGAPLHENLKVGLEPEVPDCCDEANVWFWLRIHREQTMLDRVTRGL